MGDLDSQDNSCHIPNNHCGFCYINGLGQRIYKTSRLSQELINSTIRQAAIRNLAIQYRLPQKEIAKLLDNQQSHNHPEAA